MAAADGGGGEAVALAEGEALDEAEFLVGGDDDEFAGAGDVVESSAFSADANGGGVVGAFDALAPKLFVGRGAEAGDEAVFLPQKKQVADDDGRGDVAAGADDLVGFFGFRACLYDFDEAVGRAFAALADDEAAVGDDGGCDAAQGEKAGEFPRAFAGLGVEGDEAVGEGGGDDLRAVFCGKDARGGDGVLAAFHVGLPARRAALCIKRLHE